MAGMERPRPSPVKASGVRATNLWEEIRIQGDRPARRSHHTACAFREKVYIYGGQDLREGVFRDFYWLQVSTGLGWDDCWETLPVDDNSPGYVARHTAIVSGNCMYIFGGTDNMQEKNDTYAFDFENRSWTKYPPTSPDLPPPIDSHSAVVFKNSDGHDCMLIFGGYISGMRTNRVFIFNIETSTWSEQQASGAKPTERCDHSAIVHQNAMYVIGGTVDTGRKNDFWRLDLASWTWSEVEQVGNYPEERSGHTAIVYNDTIVLFGGIQDVTREQNDMFSWNFGVNRWAQIQYQHHVEDPVSAIELTEYKKAEARAQRRATILANPNSPLPRKSTTYDNMSPGIKEPQSPFTSSPTKIKKKRLLYEGPVSPEKGHVAGNIPHARDGHTATVVGTKMVIFGGDRHQMPFNDVYSYDLKDEVLKGQVPVTY